MTPELTLVIPTYNNVIGAKELVSDMYRLHDPEMFRIISVDMTKNGIDFEPDKPVHIHIRAYKNLGFAKGQNMGWKLATTPYILLANDDIRLLDARWYEDAKKCLNKENVLGVNPFPALRTWDGGGSPTWYWKTNEKFLWTKDKPYESYTPEDYDKLKSLLTGGDGPGATTFFLLAKKELAEKVGYFDEAFAINANDYDLCRRAFIRGFKINTCTHSLVHHHCGVTKENMAKAKEDTAYNMVIQAKGLWKEKWGTPSCHDADIYGKSGAIIPNTPWETVTDL